MLANGATLEVKTKADAGQFKKLPGLKELPEMGASPEKVENTTFEDKVKKYEQGIGDPGDMAYKFKYDNESAQSSYRILRAIEKSGEIVEFKETLKDNNIQGTGCCKTWRRRSERRHRIYCNVVTSKRLGYCRSILMKRS